MSRSDDRLPEFDDRAPPDRYCDLILTGGITSAIAYPAAIFALGSAYRFNCIGGSSSGAGAAALAAAAEYRRRRGSTEGFRILLERTSALSETIGGQTKLAWLFQPAPKAARLFEVFASTFEKSTTTGRLMAFFCALLRSYKWAAVSGIAVALAAVWAVDKWCSPQGAIAYLACAFILAFLAVGSAVCWDAVFGLAKNNFGLCNGKDKSSDAPLSPLLPWLHELIQEIAGRKAGEPPLTFGDLWNAPGSPSATLGGRSPPGARSIDLQMFTANVTHGRPYRLPPPPVEEEPSRLFFRLSDLRGYFPDDIIKHLEDKAKDKRYEPAPNSGGLPACKEPSGDPPASDERSGDSCVPAGFLELPREDLPIVVAARLSLSFPILFSAVPLWAIDHERKPGARCLQKCWMSDGGACASFPIHLFDSAIPAWPTFGISLVDASPYWEKEDERIWLPPRHQQGHADRWNRFDQGLALGRLFGFLGGLLTTAKDWNDAMLARMPGVRERVVRIGLKADEGGLNLRMSPSQIRKLAEYGGIAARQLLERFAKPSTGTGQAQGWNEHRWVRFNAFLRILRTSLVGVTSAAAFDRYAQPLAEQIDDATRAEPLQGDQASQLNAAQAAALRGLLLALEDAERALATQTLAQPYEPVPRPVLRARPPL